MDKNIIKETMFSLEGAALQRAREKYFDYVADARLGRSEPIESAEQAHAEIASDLSEARRHRSWSQISAALLAGGLVGATVNHLKIKHQRRVETVHHRTIRYQKCSCHRETDVAAQFERIEGEVIGYGNQARLDSLNPESGNITKIDGLLSGRGLRVSISSGLDSMRSRRQQPPGAAPTPLARAAAGRRTSPNTSHPQPPDVSEAPSARSGGRRSAGHISGSAAVVCIGFMMLCRQGVELPES